MKLDRRKQTTKKVNEIERVVTPSIGACLYVVGNDIDVIVEENNGRWIINYFDYE